MSNLSDLLPAGASGKTIEAVATANITSKAPVILNSAGTVSPITTSSSAGTPVSFGSVGTPEYVRVVYDTNANKVVVFWMDYGNSQYGTAAVGTVSGTSISFGTAVVFNSATTESLAATFDSNANKTVTAYRDGGASSNGYAIVGTVSGTSISFGTEAAFNAASTTNIGIGFDSTANKVVIAFRDDGNSDYGTAVVGTVSGTSISYGAEAVFQTNQTSLHNLAYDPDENKMVLAYQHAGNSYYGTATVCTVSGTSISFGTAVVFKAANAAALGVVYDTTANKVVIPYAISGAGKAVVGTVSGTSISFGAEGEFSSADIGVVACAYDSTGNKTVVSYQKGTTPFNGFAVAGTVSGTSISFGTALDFTGAVTYTSIDGMNTVYDPDENKMVSAYRPGFGAVYAVDASTLTATNFVGIADAAISSAATGTVVVQGGTATGLSSLTTGSKYYVQDDGSISSPTVSGPYVIAGATYVQGFSVNAQEAIPTGLAFNTDGTKMFVSGQVGQDINEYALTTGFDVSTASFTQNFSVSAQETAPMGVAFNTDGTKMFVVGSNGDDVNEYTLSTGFDLGSTVTFIDSFSVAPQETNPIDIAFNTDGTKMFIVGGNGQDILEYALSAGFDVSTASYTQNFSVASQETGPTGMTFNTDGTKMFVVGNVADNVNSYDLSTGFDLSTASFASSFSVAANSTSPQAMSFNTTGNKMFIVGSAADSVNQYSTGVGSVTTVPAGLAISTTSLLLNGDS